MTPTAHATIEPAEHTASRASTPLAVSTSTASGSGLPSASSSASAGDAPLGAAELSFDGFRLGDRYGSKLLTRPPYHEPCDNDPIDHRARRFMVYGGKSCRDRAFPKGTTVAFYIGYSDHPSYDEPIEAFAFLGGTYFDALAGFPLWIGCPAAEPAKVYGAAVRSFDLDGRGHTLRVETYRGDVAALVEGDRVVGFAFGPMPDDPQNEQWRGLLQMYARYTDPPALRRSGEHLRSR